MVREYFEVINIHLDLAEQELGDQENDSSDDYQICSFWVAIVGKIVCPKKVC